MCLLKKQVNMKSKKLLTTIILLGTSLLPSISTAKKKPEQVLRDSITAQISSSYNFNTTYNSNYNLERILTDYSIKPSRDFKINKKIPTILKNYNQENKEELLRKYSLIWNYELATTYWVIENMRKVSENSQQKIKHFGFQNYLEENSLDKITSLDYATELYIKNQEPDLKKIQELAPSLQKVKQTSGDKNPAPFINCNPINYESKKCIETKEKWLENAIANDLKLLNSKGEFSNYKDLIKNAYPAKQYQQYLEEVKEVNNAYFTAIRKSVELPILNLWAYPFVSMGISFCK